jgi:hypothetical protein
MAEADHTPPPAPNAREFAYEWHGGPCGTYAHVRGAGPEAPTIYWEDDGRITATRPQPDMTPLAVRASRVPVLGEDGRPITRTKLAGFLNVAERCLGLWIVHPEVWAAMMAGEPRWDGVRRLLDTGRRGPRKGSA